MAFVAYFNQPASAGTIVTNINFTASGFKAVFNPGVVAPIDPVHGSFTLTFDPTLFYDFGDADSNLVLNSINVPLNAQSGIPQFLYEPSSQQLLIGMSYNGGGSQGSGSDDFMLSLFLGFPYDANYFSYVQVLNNYLYEASSVTFTIDPPLPTATTPLPPSVLMLVTSIGGLGLVGWRRRRQRAA
jgi:hypothetical protein